MIAKKRALLICGGTIDADFLREYLSKEVVHVIIGIDRGLDVLYELKLSPSYIVGDFDSVTGEALEYYSQLALEENSGIVIQRLQPEKDFTDTHTAVELAVSIGADEIVLMGATGTRYDHTTANVHILKTVLQKKIKAYILDRYNKIYLTDSFCQIHKKEQYGNFISLLPLGEQVKGITLKGFKYSLTDDTLDIGESIGISNEIIEETASIALLHGIVIVMEVKDE